jgi:integrase
LIQQDIDLEGWSLHELRHSFLSLAAANGIHPSVMQQLAGHKTASTTMEIYTHVNMASKRAAMDVMQAAYA